MKIFRNQTFDSGKKKISVVIVNYRSKKFLPNCLASIYDCFFSLPKESFEIIIVNNDPSEELTEIEKIFPKIKIVHNRKNSGFGSANNLGFNASCGELIWFLNPDVEVLHFDANKILSVFERNEKLGIIGPRLVDFSKKTQPWSAGSEINLFDLVGNNIGFPRSRKIWENGGPVAAAWVSGAAMLIRRTSFEKAQGFDPNFFVYFEDIDLCRKVRENGEKVMYFPEFSVKHFGGGSSASKESQKTEYYKSQDYYFKKHSGPVVSFAVRILRWAFNPLTR